MTAYSPVGLLRPYGAISLFNFLIERCEVTMNQELKDKWIATLRSGEYEQGQHYLYSEGKYCCLGVLLELISGEPPEEKSIDMYSLTPYLSKYYQWALAGMNDGIVDEDFKRQCYSSAHMANIDIHEEFFPTESGNGREFSFLEIADHIEAKLPVA